MKKKNILTVVCVAAVCLGSFAVVSFNSHATDESSVNFAANVEALAQGENTGSATEWACWSEVDGGSGVWVCGSPCFYNPIGRGIRGESKCYKN